MFTQDTKIILSTVPTGLGHIRVTNALKDGLPDNDKVSILGVVDPIVESLYRIISRSYLLRKSFELTQNNSYLEKIVNDILRIHHPKVLNNLKMQIDNLINHPEIKKVVIVSTHAFIADKIQKLINSGSFSKKVFHALIVTDDSAQRFWMVPADITFVPSEKTILTMQTLYNNSGIKVPNIQVAPYPINPQLTEALPPHILYNKFEQIDPQNPQRARICIPVSGAAVQLDFYKTIVDELTCTETTARCREFSFSVVTREGNYTKPFIEYFRDKPQVTFHIGANDLQTVKLYDQLYQQLNPPCLEITKPSEQCFKVLTTPTTKGGAIILLTDPVGKQEYDNLDYLQRFNFMPSQNKHQALYEILLKEGDIIFPENILNNATTWRALRLPSNPSHARKFIVNCLTSGLFQAMHNYTPYTTTNEIAPDGVKQIWSRVSDIVT